MNSVLKYYNDQNINSDFIQNKADDNNNKTDKSSDNLNINNNLNQQIINTASLLILRREGAC